MAEVRLQGPGVRPSIGESVAGPVSEHVRVRLDLKAGRVPGPLDHSAEARHAEGRPALANEHERVFAALALKLAQGPELSPRKGMRRRRTVLDPTNVQGCLVKVGLLPPKIDKLGRAEPVPESYQDHGRVAVALPIGLGRLDEALNLCRRKVLSGP